MYAHCMNIQFVMDSSIERHLGCYVHLNRSLSMDIFSFLLGKGLRVVHSIDVYLVS